MHVRLTDSVSIASTDADTVAADMMELSPSHLAPASVSSSSSVAVVKPCLSNLSLMFAAESHDDTVDRAWREHVNEVLSTSCAAAETRAVRTFHLFPRLFYVRISSYLCSVCLTLVDGSRVSGHWFVYLTRESACKRHPS